MKPFRALLSIVRETKLEIKTKLLIAVVAMLLIATTCLWDGVPTRIKFLPINQWGFGGMVLDGPNHVRIVRSMGPIELVYDRKR